LTPRGGRDSLMTFDPIAIALGRLAARLSPDLVLEVERNGDWRPAYACSDGERILAIEATYREGRPGGAYHQEQEETEGGQVGEKDFVGCAVIGAPGRWLQGLLGP
jgi:hypothetical protein